MSLKTLNRQCGAIKAKLTALELFIESLNPSISKIEVNCKMDSVKNCESETKTLRVQYYELAKDDQMEEIDTSLSTMEDRMEKIKVSLLTFIRNISDSENVNNVSENET